MTTHATPDLDFIHRFAPGVAGAPALLLLHGTGGDENDLIPLARAVAPGLSLLSPRGKVTENGMPRFFRRYGEGVFDLEDVARRADELAGFVSAATVHYGVSKPIALGFSNGANIAAAMLLRHPHALAGAALLRAQPTIEAEGKPDMTGLPVLVLSGAMDPIVPAVEAEKLAAVFGDAGADVRHETLAAAHGLTQADLEILSEWLARFGTAA